MGFPRLGRSLVECQSVRATLYPKLAMTNHGPQLKGSTKTAVGNVHWPCYAWDREIPDHAVDYGVQVRLKDFELDRPRHL